MRRRPRCDTLRIDEHNRLPEIDLRYPVGKFKRPDVAVTASVIGPPCCTKWRRCRPSCQPPLPDSLKSTFGISYRPGGWTLRQVVNHVADSHINSYVRFRWALTEESPLIKAYDEKAWAGTHRCPDRPD